MTFYTPENHSEKWTDICPYALMRLGGLPISALSDFRVAGFSEAMQQANTLDEAVEKAEADFFLQAEALLMDMSETAAKKALYNHRKRLFQKKTVSWEVLRSTLSSENSGENLEKKDELLLLAQKIALLKADREELQHRMASAYPTWMQSAMEACSRWASPSFLAGLTSSSSTLAGLATDFVQKKPDFFSKNDRQTAIGLWQAMARVAAKTSPFGHWGPVALLDMEHWPSEMPLFWMDKTKASPNAALFDLIIQVLMNDDEFVPSHKIRLNPSIFRDEAGHYQYLTYLNGQEHLQVLDENESVRLLYAHLTHPMPFRPLAKWLKRQTDATKIECMDFLRSLIQIGFLEWVNPVLPVSGSWADALMQHLAFLPESKESHQSMLFLRWLHAAARTLPHLDVPARLGLLTEARQQLADFLNKNGVEIGENTKIEPFWYEDTITEAVPLFTQEELEELVAEIQTEIQSWWRLPLSQKQIFATVVYKAVNPSNQSMRFLEFLPHLLRAEKEHTHIPIFSSQAKGIRVNQLPIGVLLQPFRDEKNRLCAVINGLYMGGGKLMNRFHAYFPDKVKHTGLAWNQLEITDDNWVDMAWTRHSNANFHGKLTGCELDTPNGRMSRNPTCDFPLSEVGVRLNPETMDYLELFHLSQGHAIHFLDLRPEAVENLPQCIQWLRQIGMPFVSRTIFEKKYRKKNAESNQTPNHLDRICLGLERRLVIARARWLWTITDFSDKKGGEFCAELNAAFFKKKLPKRVYFHVQGEKPQFLDLENPLSILHFEKYLRRFRNTDGAEIILDEALPNGEKGLFLRPDGKELSGELALEFRV